MSTENFKLLCDLLIDHDHQNLKFYKKSIYSFKCINCNLLFGKGNGCFMVPKNSFGNPAGITWCETCASDKHKNTEVYKRFIVPASSNMEFFNNLKRTK